MRKVLKKILYFFLTSGDLNYVEGFPNIEKLDGKTSKMNNKYVG